MHCGLKEKNSGSCVHCRMYSIGKAKPSAHLEKQSFQRQPAHCLIVDLTSSFSRDSLQVVTEAVSNFFCMVCSMDSGTSRVPYFCLLAVTPYIEVLVPAQRLGKTSYRRIEAAMEELQKAASETGWHKPCVRPDPKIMEHAVRDASSQFQKLKYNSDNATKLELTIISCHHASLMKAAISAALAKVSDANIKLITALCLLSSNSSSCLPEVSSQVVTSRSSVEANVFDVTGMLEVEEIHCDVIAIDSMLRNWLKDSWTDHEDLCIKFSPSRTGSDILIKCDIIERILDISELPFRQCFEINPNIAQYKSVSSAALIPCEKQLSFATATLHVLRRVPLNAICDSIVYGRPLLLRSSGCWQMEWDELETNQNRFDALCRLLADSKNCLICENDLQVKRTGVARQFEKLPRGFFALFPSESLGSMLIKPVASRELVLCCQPPLKPHWEIGSQQAMEEIGEALDRVQHDEAFNPLTVECGLVAALKTNLLSNCRSQNFPQPARGISPACFSEPAQRKPVTGKAAKFSAPRQNPSLVKPSKPVLDGLASATFNADVSIRLPKKTVSFQDFPSF